jgi:hypothetical protein
MIKGHKNEWSGEIRTLLVVFTLELEKLKTYSQVAGNIYCLLTHIVHIHIH